MTSRRALSRSSRLPLFLFLGLFHPADGNIREKTGSEQRSDTMRDFVCKRRDTRPTLSAQWLMSYSLSPPSVPSASAPTSSLYLALSLFLSLSFLRLSSERQLSSLSYSHFHSPVLSPSTPAAVYAVSREKGSILRRGSRLSRVKKKFHERGSKSKLGSGSRFGIAQLYDE